MRHGTAPTAALLLLAGCAAAPVGQHVDRALALAADQLEAQRPAEAAATVDAVLPDVLGHTAEDLRAELLLTRVHLTAYLGEPFLTEPVGGAARALGVGSSRRPSPTAHGVALVYHAAFARAEIEAARREGIDVGLDLDRADAALQLEVATTYARIGFRDLPAAVLEARPELLDRERMPGVLAELGLPRALGTWVSVLAFDHLRATDELAAYRFGVMAIEGDDRFGLALPRDEVTRIEDWIQNGASVRFVCPESGTPYLPGARRSPKSGIPQIDYIAVPRQ